ncbi:tyrosine-type recombinase/integrase [Curtobacterium citreum]|uniref:Tyrosine-type recombinase/integrase n=1 Tax=Curtobacterium citreum TaxID=2036 RepID=A0ABU8Y980_9MICO
MASISAYRNTRGETRYRVRFRKPDRTQTDKRGFRTKRAAEQWLAENEVAKARGEYLDPSDSRITVGQLAVVWLANRPHLKPSSLRPLEIAWRLHVEPFWGRVPLSAIRHSDVQGWITRLSVGDEGRRALGATSVIRAHGILASILDGAVKDRRIHSNPARGLRLPRKVPKPRAYLTHQQVEALADESGQHGLLVRFLAYTGLRWGEATALRVEDLDLLRRRVLVRSNAVDVGGVIYPGTPKSHETRTVPIARFLVTELEAASRDRSRSDLVFGNGRDYLRQPDSRRGWFKAARARAAAADPAFPVVTLHDLRHTAASLSVATGANVKVIQRMLGHASAAMTLDTYADLFDADLDVVADALDQARSTVVVGEMWAEASA